MWIVILLLTIGFYSCKQDSGSSSDDFSNGKKSSHTIFDIEEPHPVKDSTDKYIDTRYAYADPKGKKIVFENSLPKGGLKVTDSNGKEYVYAIFWTRITNETDSPFKLTLNLSADSVQLTNSSDNYFKIFFPSTEMSIEKAPLFNYGLTNLESVLDSKVTLVEKIINSNESKLFYVVAFFKEGLEGPVRAGFSLNNNKVFYKVNEKVIQIGHYNIKNVELIK